MEIYNKDREFYTFKDKYVRHFVLKPIKGCRVCAFNRYFESEQTDQKLSTTNKHLNIDNDEISIVTDQNFEYITITEKKYQKLLIGEETDYGNINEKEKDDFVKKSLRFRI